MSELRKILNYHLDGISLGKNGLDSLRNEVLSWHKSERKKWAIDIVEEVRNHLLTSHSINQSSKIGVGVAIAEICKEIEEG